MTYCVGGGEFLLGPDHVAGALCLVQRGAAADDGLLLAGPVAAGFVADFEDRVPGCVAHFGAWLGEEGGLLRVWERSGEGLVGELLVGKTWMWSDQDEEL